RVPHGPARLRKLDRLEPAVVLDARRCRTEQRPRGPGADGEHRGAVLVVVFAQLVAGELARRRRDLGGPAAAERRAAAAPTPPAAAGPAGRDAERSRAARDPVSSAATAAAGPALEV